MLDQLYHRNQLSHSFEREIFTVQRNQHGVGGDEGIERQEAERGRAIDEHVVVLIAHRSDQGSQPFFAMGERHHFDFGAGQLSIGRHQHQTIDDGRDDEQVRI